MNQGLGGNARPFFLSVRQEKYEKSAAVWATRTLDPLVEGSNPSWPTKFLSGDNDLRDAGMT
jgi:hypothetical protein